MIGGHSDPKSGSGSGSSRYGGERVAIAARMDPNTSEAEKAELQGIVDSIEFDTTPTQPSATPAAP